MPTGRRSALTFVCAAFLQASVAQHFHHRLLIVVQSVQLQSHETQLISLLNVYWPKTVQVGLLPCTV